jgi:DNA-binding FadR family transcriptional regulator
MPVVVPTGKISAVSADLSRTLLRPERDGNTFERTVERLAQAIKLGVYQLGDGLPPERELADIMQVSRTTLREALNALREAGFVETRRGRGGGTYVVFAGHPGGSGRAEDLARRMGERLEDALAFRRVVEPGAVATAATKHLATIDVEHLHSCLAAVEQADDDSRRRVADSRLHLALVLLAGSDSLTAAVAEVQVRLGELLAAIPVLRPNIEHSDRQHRAVVEAVVAGDAEGARIAMEAHCDGTAALLRGLLG